MRVLACWVRLILVPGSCLGWIPALAEATEFRLEPYQNSCNCFPEIESYLGTPLAPSESPYRDKMASQELQRVPASDTMAWSEIPATSVPDILDSTPIENERLFKLVERRSRKRNANSKSPAATSADHSTLQNASTRVSALHGGLPRKHGPVWKPKPIQRLHREDTVIILKPRVTVALKDVYIPTWRARSSAAASLSLLPTWEQNLIVAGTRDPHVADKLLCDFQLDSSIGQLLMHGHLKLTGEVCRGVITVANHETSESLQNKIQYRAGELADIRKLGNSNVAALTFVGKVVPRFVHYNSEATHVLAYERTIPVCGRCGTVGHRADTCPCPDNEKCGLCGHTVPTPDGSVGKPMQPTPATARESSANSSCPATRPNALSPEQPEAYGGAGLGAHGSDPKTLSPPPLLVTSVHGKKTAPPPPPPSGKNTCHFPALKTDGATSARASTPKHGKQHNSAHNTSASLPVGTARDEAAGDLVNGASQAGVLPTAGLELASTPDQEGGDQAAAASTACGPGLLTAASWELPRGPTSDAAPVPGVAKKAIANVATAGPSVDDAAAVNGHSNP
ncbi:hypothetical protein HPB49_013017 [Dermacentor silvarum]|uniref:Uncharacterized protein n=1 Tax=Dermacentor silvarum TaxID=543639 RepID=A0ACB8E0F8_DERSI|nr:hypothetical protein HPB49_013017 [Dermacentor silvarum]